MRKNLQMSWIMVDNVSNSCFTTRWKCLLNYLSISFHGNLAYIPDSKGAFCAVVLIAKRSYISCNANFQRNCENCIFSLSNFIVHNKILEYH